jgi:hypothetical protein
VNVVLVDGMPHGLKIVGTRRVNNRIQRPPVGLHAVYRASRELDTFLRCDVTGGNPVLESFRASCTWGPPKYLLCNDPLAAADRLAEDHRH